MGAAQSLMACCTNRDKKEFVLLPVDVAPPEKDQQWALDAQGPQASLLPPSPQTITTQVDTPKIQDFRLAQADASDKAPEVGCASSSQALQETPRSRWIADNGAPRAMCIGASNSDPPPPPRPGFRATAVEKEDQTEVDVVLTPNSKGVPNPSLAFLEDVAEATKVVEATDMPEIEAARAAHFVEETGWSCSSLSSCHLESPATSANGPAKTLGRSLTGPLQRDLPRWSVNSEDSLVAKSAERMHRQRAGRVPGDQQQQQQPQRRGPSEPQLEAKLADRMEQQLFKERTGVGSVALVRQSTWACDGGGIGFVDKALERRLEQQRLKAEGMRPQ